MNADLAEIDLAIDDSAFDYLVNGGVCTQCLHFKGRNGVSVPVCIAFPNGVPSKIFNGENDHTKPFPGDHGLTFTSKTK